MHDRHARYRRPDADPRRRPTDGFRASGTTRFRRLVEDAVASLPSGITQHLDGVELHIGDVPAAPEAEPASAVLARYEPPASGAEDGGVPGRFVVFRRPLEARAGSKRDLVELIRETVVREIADHLGIDDDGLDELGWP